MAALPVLVWVIIAQELLGGIASAVWLIIRGYTNRRCYAAFIALHNVIIAGGIVVMRQPTKA